MAGKRKDIQIKKNRAKQSDTLHRRAEKIAREKPVLSPEKLEALSPEKIHQILHELRVCRVEKDILKEELHQVQEKLDAERVRFLNIYDLAPWGYLIISDQGLILEANLPAAALLGVVRDNLVKQPMIRFIVTDDHDQFYLHCKQLFKTGEPQVCNMRILKKDGTTFWGHLSASTVTGAAGEPVCRVALSDISALKTEKDRSQQYLDIAGVIFIAIDTEQNVALINNKGCEVLGYKENEIIGRNWFDNFIEAENIEEIKAVFNQIISDKLGAAEYYENTVITKEGDKRLVGWHNSIIKDVSGSVIGTLSSGEDITDRKRIEEVLRRENLIVEEYINSLPGLFYVFDEHRFVRWNSEWSRITGYSNEELASKYGPDFFEGEDRTLISEQMQKVFLEGASEAEAELVTKDGRRIPCFFNGLRKRFEDKDYLIGLEIDITDRRRIEKDKLVLERHVQHAQKLESLGVLAGGIAHDFNNLLMGILGNADLVLDVLSPMSPARTYIREIEKASKRAAELARQMLAYSGKGRFIIEPIYVNQLVEEIAHLLEVSISKKAVLKYSFAENLPTFEGDATQICQVIMNLITNASEAVGEERGVITLSTGMIDCDWSYLNDINEVLRVNHDEPLAEGVYVFIEVTDTGCGMNKETINKIFDPFFTTKFTGRGLGMSAVLGIVRGHMGSLKIYSEVGKGTSFKVLFPTKEFSDKGVIFKRKEEIERKDWRGSGTVLIADDDEIVCTVGKQMLARMGFRVLTASDGSEALKIFRKHAKEIICVLLDLTMPRMNGEETFREMRRLHPGVIVILCSGYNEQDAVQSFSGKGLAGFIQKPFSMAALKEKLMEVL
ncbi:MAG: PAS domain S-box protein [Candidatus Theseobacter exili]|nr:PAS domain S-box protein [Candidatus Theseobacter exili]